MSYPVGDATPLGKVNDPRAAFDRMFARFNRSTIVLSYSSNGFPDLSELQRILRRYKPNIEVHEKTHRYNFGTHAAATRNSVTEYLVIGR
jgi:adenine-specific DNA-methyltransferase